ILRLGGQRVRLAVELLHEEVESPARGLGAADDAADFGDMSGETIELLVDIEALEQDGQLLLEALLINVGFQLGQTLIQPRANLRVHLRKTGTDVRHQRLESIATLLQQLA